MKRYIYATDTPLDISIYEPDAKVIKKLMDYRSRASRVNVKAIKDPNKLLTYYYGAKLIGWGELAEDIYLSARFKYPNELSAIAQQVKPDPAYADTRSKDDIELGLSDSKGLFTFDQRKHSGAPSCWLPKQFLKYLVDNNIPVHFGKRTSGAEWDRNGTQWSEVEHLTLFPGTANEFDYEIVVHTSEHMDGATTYTSDDTYERVSAKKLIEGLDRRLRRKGLI